MAAHATYSSDSNAATSAHYDVEMTSESSYSAAHGDGDDEEDGEEEEEEEDEAFPVSFGPAAVTPKSFSSSVMETNKAFSAFFGDGNSEDEDEPLPVKPASPPPAPPVAPPAVASAETTPLSSPCPPSVAQLQLTGTDNDEEETEEDEPLPTASAPAPAEPSAPAPATPPPPAPPMSPPPPPPLESPPPVNRVEATPAQTESTSPPPPPPSSPAPETPKQEEDVKMEEPARKLKDASDSSSNSHGDDTKDADAPKPAKPTGPIDYNKYFQYRELAQQLNQCLEMLSEVRHCRDHLSLWLLILSDDHALLDATDEARAPALPVCAQSCERAREAEPVDAPVARSLVPRHGAHCVYDAEQRWRRCARRELSLRRTRGRRSSASSRALDDHSHEVRRLHLLVQLARHLWHSRTLLCSVASRFGSRQCVLVGDPQQLSATVFSRTSGQSLYERSLFERLETCGHPVHMLRTQYRSHPLISAFPRHYFYDGKLQDGENVKTESYTKPYHQHLGPAFMPLTFWNLLGSRETSSRSVSRSNAGEAELAVNLYLTLKNSCPPDAIAGKVGMITPYSQQMEELRTRFRRALGDRFDQEVEINTVDGFQGREKDIIICTSVVA